MQDDPRPHRSVKIGDRPINLTQALKLAGCVQSGGEAKLLIADGRVRVNGEVELRKRRKMCAWRSCRRGRRSALRPGDLTRIQSGLASPALTQGSSAMEGQPLGSSASSRIMFGMSSSIEKRGPHRVQMRTSPSRRRGALPSGHTKSDNGPRFTMGGFSVDGCGLSICGVYYVVVGGQLSVVSCRCQLPTESGIQRNGTKHSSSQSEGH